MCLISAYWFLVNEGNEAFSFKNMHTLHSDVQLYIANHQIKLHTFVLVNHQVRLYLTVHCKSSSKVIFSCTSQSSSMLYIQGKVVLVNQIRLYIRLY